jgi:hypothetical protein
MAVFATAPAYGVDSSFTLNPRFEGVGADGRDFSDRTFLKTQSLIKNGSFGFNTEAYFEYDFANLDVEPRGTPDLRKSRSTAALQEAYLDYQMGPVFFRAGRQPVRWSQSWTVPSLDIFTGRRWNRLFLDPVPEQLTHPDGVLISYAVADIEAEVFQLIQTAENIFPQPFPNIDRRLDPQTGVRIKARLNGLDLQLVSRFSADDNLFGASANYALNCCVLKAEAGQSGEQRGFTILGLDVFESFWGGDLTFGPQVTWYQDPLLTHLKVESIVYAPMRYAYGRTSVELQYYDHLQKRERFTAALVAHELGEIWKTAFKLTGYAQRYEGEQGRLFGIYEYLTDSNIYGVRLDLTTSF